MGLQKYSTAAVTTKLRTVVLASAESWSSSSLEYVGGATVFWWLAIPDAIYLCCGYIGSSRAMQGNSLVVRTYILRTYFLGGLCF